MGKEQPYSWIPGLKGSLCPCLKAAVTRKQCLSLPPLSKQAWPGCLLPDPAFGARSQCLGFNPHLHSPAVAWEAPSLLQALLPHPENEDADSRRHTSSGHRDQPGPPGAGAQPAAGTRGQMLGWSPGLTFCFRFSGDDHVNFSH